jgi:hypothetical protein
MSQLSGFWYLETVVILLLAWIAALIFPVAYALTMRFWESELGMHFFTYGVAVWLNLTPSVIFFVFGNFPGRGIIVASCFHLMAFVIVWRATVFTKILFRSRRKGDGLTPHHTQKEELQ